MSQRRRKSERTKNLHFQGLFAYSEKFSKIKPSGNMYIMKGIFSDQIIFMVHIPFKFLSFLFIFELFPFVEFSFHF